MKQRKASPIQGKQSDSFKEVVSLMDTKKDVSELRWVGTGDCF